MRGWMIAAAVALFLIALLSLPVSIRIDVTVRSAFARGKARVGLCFGLIGATLHFTACKTAAGRLEARVWFHGGRERIFTLPGPKELLGMIGKAKDKPKKKKRKAKSQGESHATRWVKAILRGGRVRKASVKGTLGAGDAAATALAVGAVSGAVYAILTPKMKKPPQVLIRPDFDETTVHLELAGIVDVNLGKSTLDLIRR